MAETDQRRILVIEDEELIRSVIVAFVTTANFHVIEAANGAEGLKLAKEHVPDMILCDINMPKMDGFRVLAELRREPITAGIPFIFLTGQGEKPDIRRGMNFGADDYLTKPFTRAELLRAIDARLSKKLAITQQFDHQLREAEEKLQHVMHHDSLTNLPNRLSLREQLNQMLFLGSQKHVALLAIGIDRFERINESMGFPHNDALLKLVAERLSQSLTPKDMLARLQAEQFAIILSGVNEQEAAAKVARKILDKISETYLVNGLQISLTASVGITMYPSDGMNIDHLIKYAEAAMNHVKRQGGNAFEFYTSQLHSLSADQIQLESSLRHALERNQLEIYYQPVLDLSSGKMVSAEALVRWHHPERGLVSPAEFIPLAEETDLILTIGEWVIKNACAQLHEWQGKGFNELGMGVNVSSKLFNQPQMTTHLSHFLTEHQLKSNSVSLEVTESILMKDIPYAIATMNVLRRTGFRMCVDDFGTGYSSLSYLTRFSFDVLKIDRIFIRDISEDSKNAAITIAIIDMAHSLKLEVVAEGVETAQELAFLRAHGCDKMQGFLFSPPVPAKEFERLLTSGVTLVTSKQKAENPPQAAAGNARRRAVSEGD